MKAIGQLYFPVVVFFMLHKAVLTYEPVDKILEREHSSERFLAIHSCGAVLLFCRRWMEFVWPLQ